MREKAQSAGTDDFARAQVACSRGLLAAHERYIVRTRDRLRSLPRGSKLWWRLSQVLAGKQRKEHSCALRIDGQWVCDATSKANAFADTFTKKWVTPLLETNEFSAVPPCEDVQPDSRALIAIRVRCAAQELRGLRAESATGPDLLPARISRECAMSLALPVAKLARRIVACGAWPRMWCGHWVMPLHKKSTVHDPDHYRSIQLTPQLSKCLERLLGRTFLPRLQSVAALGLSQFAYRPGHGCRDALLYMVLIELAQCTRARASSCGLLL